ncbi:hypothetical protein OWV82_001052 [Melia azedarach]|uniref:Uncharacterized protein n=1 Tax=Melia azedarach TaxID=155640 RepID=A0ACC1YX19_MELAZ|nr:hypothetical protein OWV82_001052 [Melia azedarach]
MSVINGNESALAFSGSSMRGSSFSSSSSSSRSTSSGSRKTRRSDSSWLALARLFVRQYVVNSKCIVDDGANANQLCSTDMVLRCTLIN